jgi:predicted DNA binding protein
MVEVELSQSIRHAFAYFLDKFESMELLELIKIDFKEGTKLAIAALTLKEGSGLEEVRANAFIEMLTVLSQEKNRYVCLIKTRDMRKVSAMLALDTSSLEKEYSFDIVWDTPTIFTHDKIVCSVIGTEENLKRFLDLMAFAGKVRTLSYTKATYGDDALLSCLTKQQRRILIEAKRSGYYAYPRRISSEQLAQNVGLSKPTVLQHLRKAEIRLLSQLLAGY